MRMRERRRTQMGEWELCFAVVDEDEDRAKDFEEVEGGIRRGEGFTRSADSDNLEMRIGIKHDHRHTERLAVYIAVFTVDHYTHI